MLLFIRNSLFLVFHEDCSGHQGHHSKGLQDFTLYIKWEKFPHSPFLSESVTISEKGRQLDANWAVLRILQILALSSHFCPSVVRHICDMSIYANIYRF